MAVPVVRSVTFEDVAVLKHALNFELGILWEKSDVEASLLMGLNGQVLASRVGRELDSDLFRLLNMVRANIPLLRREMTVGGIEQSITRYRPGNVVASRVGRGELLLCILRKESSITSNLADIYRCVQILSHISRQKAITESELADYGQDVADELAELTWRLYAELESEGTVGEKKKNEEVLARFETTLGRILGQAESEMAMVTSVNELGIQTKEVSSDQWRQLVALLRRAVEAKAGRYYAEMAERQLMDIVEEAERLF